MTGDGHGDGDPLTLSNDELWCISTELIRTLPNCCLRIAKVLKNLFI